MSELILIDGWVGCYRGGWKGVIVDTAFAHPAKVAFNLARRIYEHAIEEQWIASGDTVVDPFGGIGGCAFHGLMNGMIVVTNELEEKFVNLSKENRELWRKQYTGLPGFNADNWIILQGDSRKLASVIREAGLSVSSPPYASGCAHTGGDDPKPEHLRGGDYHSVGLHLGVSSPPYIDSVNSDRSGIDWDKAERPERWTGNRSRYGCQAAASHEMKYGATDGQLGAMPEGKLCVSSPPFPQPYTGGGGINTRGYGKDGADKVGSRTYQSQGGDRAEGNLETLEIGSVDMAITSPPYNPPMSQDHNGSRGGKRGTEPSETGAFVKYGTTEGQIEGLSMKGFQTAISSPPYVSGGHHPDQTGAWGGQAQANTKEQAGYGREDGQMGQMKEGDFDLSVSSPPYENAVSSGRDGIDFAKAGRPDKMLSEGYKKNYPIGAGAQGDYAYNKLNPDNVGNQSGDTFWSASRTILEQLYSVLTPGAHAIFIVKAFVRNKQIVDFPGQWAQLCEAVGFKLIHDHHAMLTEHSGTQGGMFGADKEYKVKRVSFFRRLHERRAPETEIFCENVMCFERP